MPANGTQNTRRGRSGAGWSTLIVLALAGVLGSAWLVLDLAASPYADLPASSREPETTVTRPEVAVVAASTIDHQPRHPGPEPARPSGSSTPALPPGHRADPAAVASASTGHALQSVPAATIGFPESGGTTPAYSGHAGTRGGGGVAPIGSAGGRSNGSSAGTRGTNVSGGGGTGPNSGAGQAGAGGSNGGDGGGRGGGRGAATGPEQPSAGPEGGTGDSSEPTIIAGAFSPGASPGTLQDDDIILLADAWLTLEVAGRIPGLEYDRVIALDELHLDGTLEIVLLDGFMPIAGDIFDFFDWGTLTGQFSQIIVPALDGGLQWDLSDLYVNGEVGVDGPSAAASPIQAVPMPATLVLLGLGLALGVLRLRRLRPQAARPLVTR